MAIIAPAVWLIASGLAYASNSTCKVTSSSPQWPGASEWSQLNHTLNGSLLAPLPPAVVCDSSRPQYNPSKCGLIDKQWFSGLFHNADPVSLLQPNWQNDSCLPSSLYNGSNSCELAPFAKYVVNASTAQHVENSVKFAISHNLRVSVKNTGHDYLGRSTSPDFQVWTHHLKHLEYEGNYQSCGPSESYDGPVVIVGGGNQYGEIYEFAAKHDSVVVGGEEPSVGFGGHLTGGGHSPLGSLYGLNVDNVLEMSVITPTGDLVVANDCQNSDLFWAMRGGGGSTFGILINATVKAYKNLPAARFNLTFAPVSADKHDDFISLLADMHGEMIRWSDNNVNGYYSTAATSLIGSGTITEPRLSFGGHGLNQSVDQLNATMWPFAEMMNATDGVQGTLTLTPVAKTSDLLRKSSNLTAGVNLLLGSRLWDKDAMQNKTGIAAALKAIVSKPGSVVQGAFVSGPGVRDESKVEDTSVTPAWRRTYLHEYTGAVWAGRNPTQAQEARAILDFNRQTLQDLAPSMGAYLNEADVEQPDPAGTFWGHENYARLEALKRKLDPHGVFWCSVCVGHEAWRMDEETGSLCRIEASWI